jgi:predicted dienelactone hydrolase
MKPLRASLVLVVAVLGVAALGVAGCGGAADKGTRAYIADGAKGVGYHTFTFVDGSRPTPPNGSYPGAPDRTLPVDVWYPSSIPPGNPTRDAPLAGGPHPLVLYSHGFKDNRTGESYFAEHLASYGYVVAAPDYPLSNGNAPGNPTIRDLPSQPLDARFVIDQLLDPSVVAGTALAHAIDPKRIAASGLSLGALTALLQTFHPRLRDPRVLATFAIAPPACFLTEKFYQTAHVPLVLLAGDADLIVPVPENSQRAFDRAQPPSELILLRHGSHTGFTGLAALFDQTMNLDRIGCTAVEGQVNATSFATVGSEDEGIAQDPAVCPMPCTGTPIDPSLNASRQQDLAKAAALAFFDSVLKADVGAHLFMISRLAAENPEVSLQVR